ncbi:Uncharacterized protein APZ42_034192 [Daphnia magna]|uniref:THAP-type domain-containing protein n=1 Tax=Daphnia magna TaxID=35525 RepID=A0A164KCY8_9CRUS|nr:Uncharacterized protein APZ42_034192 [Daphnia magna]
MKKMTVAEAVRKRSKFLQQPGHEIKQLFASSILANYFVHGNVVFLSKVIDEMKDSRNSDVQEIRIVGLAFVHVDCDLNNDIWHGQHIVQQNAAWCREKRGGSHKPYDEKKYRLKTILLAWYIILELVDPDKGLESLHKYPRIKALFLRFNTGLPSSVPVKRLFSAGPLILTARRNRLSDDFFEMLSILKKGHEEKVTVFTTKDKKLQQKWTKLIQRKNYRVSDKSYVCANHFCDEDIVKGTTQIVGGKEHFTPKNWVLKEGACPTIFQNCPEHFSRMSADRKRKLCNSSKETDSISKTSRVTEIEFETSNEIDKINEEEDNIPPEDITNVVMCLNNSEVTNCQTETIIDGKEISIPPEDITNAGVCLINSDVQNCQTQIIIDGEQLNWGKEELVLQQGYF